MNPKKISSELPENIRHHILSLMPTSKAMVTAQLSKTWKDDWLSLPCLDLDHHFFKQSSAMKRTFTILSKQEKQRRHTLFCDFLTRILTRRAALLTEQGRSSCLHLLQRLSLFIPYLDDTSTPSRSDKLLEHAFSRFIIEELEFIYNCFPEPFEFKLPCHVYARSLKSLSLTGVAVHQSTMDMLATNCPFLELMRLSHCQLLDSVIEFRGLSKLTELCLTWNQFVEGQIVINLPCLESLFYSAEAMFQKDQFDMDVIRAEELKYLTLHNVKVNDGLLDRFLPRLHSLHRLELKPSRYTERLRIINHCLKHLILKLNLLNLSELHIEAPNLEDFIYYHTVKTYEERTDPPLFRTDNFAPKKATVQLRQIDLKNVKFVSLLKKINQRSKYTEVHMNSMELHTATNDRYNYDPVYEIRHVVLLDQTPNALMTPPYLGGALRLFPNVETLVVSQVKYYMGEVYQKVKSFKGNVEKQVKRHYYTKAVFESMA